VNQDDLKLNGTRELLVYAVDVTIEGRSVFTIKENTVALVAASKWFGREKIADNIKHMVMSLDQNAGRSHNMKSANSSL